MPNPKVDLLIAIRNGKYKRSEIEEIGKQLKTDAIEAQAKSPLPDSVDLAGVSELITQTYLDFWNAKG